MRPGLSMSTESVGDMEVRDTVMGDQELCLQTRKWWCFLLSSICTFIMGILSVLVVRAAAAIFCRRVSLNDQAYIAWLTSIRYHNER